MVYYIYENWTADKKMVIHKGECRFCNNGRGIHKSKQEGRNGEWHGPFDSYDSVKEKAYSVVDRELRECRFCM